MVTNERWIQCTHSIINFCFYTQNRNGNLKLNFKHESRNEESKNLHENKVYIFADLVAFPDAKSTV